jgi:hypothetical protein
VETTGFCKKNRNKEKRGEILPYSDKPHRITEIEKAEIRRVDCFTKYTGKQPLGKYLGVYPPNRDETE